MKHRKHKTSRKETMYWNNIQGRKEMMSCTRKVKRSKAEAINYAKKHDLYYYKCEFCGKYHVTKQPTQNAKPVISIWQIIKPLIKALTKGEV